MTPIKTIRTRTIFRDGDLALLLDRKSRRYLITLAPEQVFHSHLGGWPMTG